MAPHNAQDGLPLVGDMNQDGVVDAQDVNLLRQLLDSYGVSQSLFEQLPPEQRALLDINGDGEFNREDLTALCQQILKGEPQKADELSHRLMGLRKKMRSS